MRRGGFTLAELAIVMVITAVLAIVVYPTLAGLGAFPVSAAARRLAQDLRYARSLAMSTHAVCGVRFEPPAARYTVFVATPATPAPDPLRPGQPLQVALAGSGVALAASFGGGAEVRFDPLGQPLDAAGRPFATEGHAILTREDACDTVTVDPFSGGVSGP
jgi:prepilin-type N-terminal cleavage/methylation domain-containing protein